MKIDDFGAIRRYVSDHRNTLGRAFTRLPIEGDDEVLFENGAAAPSQGIITLPLFKEGDRIKRLRHAEINPAFMRKFGYALREPVGEECGIIAAVHNSHCPYLYSVTMDNAKDFAMYSYEMSLIRRQNPTTEGE